MYTFESKIKETVPVMVKIHESSQPKVSVLIPVHRNDINFEKALESVNFSCYANFDILVLDNTDIGINIDFLKQFDRVKYFRLQPFIGPSESLNVGIRESNAKYLAVMHSDDLMIQERLCVQVSYLEYNSQVDIIGGSMEIFGSSNDPKHKIGISKSRSDANDKIIEYMLHKNPLFHPTTMIRRDKLIHNNLYYRKKYDSAEDYDLWIRASRKLIIKNLPDVVIKYRIHDQQFGYEKREKLNKLVNRIQIRHALWIIFHDRHLLQKALKTFTKIFLNSFKK